MSARPIDVPRTGLPVVLGWVAFWLAYAIALAVVIAPQPVALQLEPARVPPAVTTSGGPAAGAS
ncbi:hypothetical protein [Pannonibacter tanglangensis]|uniref:Uncharacterized protein n=1 Tax=Pannonibacter tanglangensis TaxID=2750084 RepID=A0ABW9ZL67_9HYPH|nr:hypothetical protein [Pannonibacter sp. XCT-34]NBN64783.1 hypothetical protein [Pannonibacter sp. XCT-34]